jgi:hypothetical protein
MTSHLRFPDLSTAMFFLAGNLFQLYHPLSAWFDQKLDWIGMQTFRLHVCKLLLIHHLSHDAHSRRSIDGCGHAFPFTLFHPMVSLVRV